MDFRRYLLLFLACLLACGCRRDPYMDAYYDMLNAEKRALEDRIYELEYDYEQKVKELEACRKPPDGKRETVRKPPRREETKSEKYEPDIPNEFPKIEVPSGAKLPSSDKTSAAAKDNVGLVSYVSPTPPDPTGEAPPPPPPALLPPNPGARPIAASSDDAPPAKVGLASYLRDMATSIPALGPDQVAHIYLNSRATHGDDFDQQSGDDGLSVLIEPRNHDGQFVGKPGKVSLVVLDPALQGEAARVARWDFEPDVARGVLRTDTLDRGLHFRVPWPNRPPEHERLHLFVRYVTEDGRSLEAHREITVRLPDRDSQEWTVRTATKPEARTVAPAVHEEPVVQAAPTAAQASSEVPLNSPAHATTARNRFWKPSR